MSDLRKLELANRGSVATVVLENLRPELDALKSEAVESYKNLFRAGNHELAAYMAAAAQLVALDNLEAKFRQRVNVGIRAAEELQPKNPERQ